MERFLCRIGVRQWLHKRNPEGLESHTWNADAARSRRTRCRSQTCQAATAAAHKAVSGDSSIGVRLVGLHSCGPWVPIS